jgi:hypothetical protein
MTGTVKPVDAILLQGQCALAADIACHPQTLQALLPGWHAQAAWAQSSGEAYVYLVPPQRMMLETAGLAPYIHVGQQLFPALEDLRASRLEKAFEAQGAATGQAATAHYVVEMDPEGGWMPQLCEWYDTEHMPGLAQVPGTVRARRFLNHDHGPLSLACYDLDAPTVLNSPPWLLVRATSWSDRMRPHFTNTKRTMFDCVN